MPIKDKSKYPPNWKQISLQVRAEAGNRCELCGALNGTPIKGNKRGSKVVLTVHHKDADPGNNSRGNLVALCQKCHLAADRELRKHKKQINMREERGLAMTREELANKLGALSPEEFANHKYDLSGFVVVSCTEKPQDTGEIQLSGDINEIFSDEECEYIGGKIFIDTNLTPMYKVKNKYWCNKNDRPFYPQPRKGDGNVISAKYDCLWWITTSVPHSSFRISEDGYAIYAGIVINTADLSKVWPKKKEGEE